MSTGKSLQEKMVGTGIGVLLILVSWWLIGWNENRVYQSTQVAQRPEQNIIAVSSNSLSSRNDGKLVYITGKITTDETLRDNIFDVSSKALKLSRTVQMYQWEEVITKKQQKSFFGGGKTFEQVDYQQTWSDKIINSSEFQFAGGVTYENPTSIPISSLTQTAKDAKMGKYSLSPDVLEALPEGKSVDLGEVNIEKIQERFTTPIKLQHDGTDIFIGDNLKAPNIGNLRISIHAVLPGPYSIVAQQVNGRLNKYQDAQGRRILVVKPGIVPLSQMLDRASVRSGFTNWIFRGVIFAIWVAGFLLIVRNSDYFASKIKFIKRLQSSKGQVLTVLLALSGFGVILGLHWLSYAGFVAVLTIAVSLAIAYAGLVFIK